VPTLTHARRPLVAALVVLAAVLVTQGGPAVAAKSCAAAVIDDWYGNSRVDKRYPLHCYREAVASLSPAEKDYMHAEDDILRALAYAKKGKSDPGVVSSTVVRASETASETTTGEEAPAESPSSEPGSPLTTVAADDVADVGKTGIPLPLILLGGLALVLLAAGGAGVVSRWLGRGPDADGS